MEEFVPDTLEIAPVTQEPQALKFVIRETIADGKLIFHPGQEQLLVDAKLPVGTIRGLFERGTLSGQYPGFAPIEKNLESFTQNKTGN